MPVGPEGPQWSTRAGAARVLFVVHNVTSATRLLDVLPLFDADPRVQCLATCTGSSPYLHGVPELLANAGLPVLPWEQAAETPVDLAISASYGGELHLIQGKLAILSHGIGYNKRLPTPDTGHRTPDTGHRTPGAGGPGRGRSLGGRRFSGSRRSGYCATGSPLPRRPSCPTPSSSPASAASARPLPVRPYSPVTRASIACWPRSLTATTSAAPSASPPVSASSSSTPPGGRAPCSATRTTSSPGSWTALPENCPSTATAAAPSCTPTSGTGTAPARSVPGCGTPSTPG